MAHADPYDLAAWAAGAAPDAATRAHVHGCAECLSALESLRETVARPEPEHLPSASVWPGVHASLGLAPELGADPLRPDEAPAPVAPAARSHAGRRTPRRQPIRRRRGAWIAGLAAASVVIAVIGVLVGIRIAAPPNGPTPTVVAQAALDPFPGWDDSGRAVVEETAGGGRYLKVTLPGAVPEGDVREVWLMRSDLKALISLGLLEGGTGRFAVPAGIDLAQYDVVDVSAEPVDGDPAHSGRSIVRGVLKAA